ncbi:MAG TPA: O-antigen ligase domain-containing protein, partial [Pseudomonadales bacterium]|nr:O-antigen ligase domain-containing protein [Pseudomonadales bacterium]
RLSVTPVVFCIVASVFFVAICFPVSMMFSETYTPEFSKQWYSSPVFNMHIRHTGYQITAASAALLIFLHARSGYSNHYLLVSLVLWTFLFWCGGRAAAASLMATGLLVGLFLYSKQLPLRHYLVSLIGLALISFLFSEWLSVFHWNGLMRGVERSLEVAGFDSVSSGRLKVWLTTIEYIVRYPLFGLGPEGYVFMPGRVYGVHPHNIFLQFLIEWGLIGTILFLTILARAFFAGFMSHVWGGKTSPATLSFGSVAGGCIIVALGIHILTDGTFYHPYPTACLAIAFAIWTIPPNVTLSDGSGAS